MVLVTRAPGPIGLGPPETDGLWQGQSPNSPRQAFPGGTLSPHPGSDLQALPAAPPPFPKHTSAGGRGGPVFPRDPWWEFPSWGPVCQ